MSRFNKTSQGNIKIDESKTTNHQGGISYERNNIKMEIASLVLNSMLKEDSFYESSSDRLERLETLVKSCASAGEYEFLAKTLVYTRTIGNLRSISHVIAILLTENIKGSNFLRPALVKSFIRMDDLTECLSFWNLKNPGLNIPNSLRRAFKDRLEVASDYELKKYEGKNNKVKLRDVALLARPKRDLKALIEGKLPNISTVRTINAGSIGEERAENYEALIKSKKLPYMGAVKNIKNMLEAGISEESIELLCEYISNEKAVRNSKLLPMRFYDAYNIVKNISYSNPFIIKKLLSSLEKAFMISANNIDFVEEGEKLAILLDDSGSMSGNPFYYGKLLTASILTGVDKDNTIGYLWANTARTMNIDSSPMKFIENTFANGGGTDVSAPLKRLIRDKIFVDKIIILTDMQMQELGYTDEIEFKDSLSKYKKINPNVKVLFWNLGGYSSGTPIKLTDDILEVCGISDKLVEVASKMLNYSDLNYLVKEIESVEL